MGTTAMIFLCSIFVVLALSAQCTASQVNYDNYQVIEVSGIEDFSDEENFLQALEIPPEEQLDILHEDAAEGKVQLLVKPELKSSLVINLKKLNLEYRIQVENVGEEILRSNLYYLRRNEGPLNGNVTFDRYMKYEEICEYMDSLVQMHPNRVRVQEIGRTVENRPIKMIVISSLQKGQIKRSSNSPIIFIEAGIHAREWISPSSALFVVDHVLESTDPQTQSTEWRIVVVTNPDGYVYTWETDRLWRKNRFVEENQVCVGVDLNRNFDFHWKGPGSSTRHCSGAYKGTSVFSEKESQAIRSAVMEVNTRIKAYVSIHSYGQYILYPPGIQDISVIRDADHRLMNYAAAEMSRTIYTERKQKYTYGYPAKLLYPASGLTMDWAHIGAGIPLSFTYEMRDKGNDGFLLDASKIVDTVMDFWVGMEVLLKHVHELDKEIKVNKLTREEAEEEEVVSETETIPEEATTLSIIEDPKDEEEVVSETETIPEEATTLSIIEDPVTESIEEEEPNVTESDVNEDISSLPSARLRLIKY